VGKNTDAHLDAVVSQPRSATASHMGVRVTRAELGAFLAAPAENQVQRGLLGEQRESCIEHRCLEPRIRLLLDRMTNSAIEELTMDSAALARSLGLAGKSVRILTPTGPACD
jgi:hypothetical protein